MKRILSVFLACCFLMGAFPVTAFAVTDNSSNDSIESAQGFSLGDEISGGISTGGDTDFYRFTLSEAGTVTLDTTAYMEWYSLLVYDGMGTRLWYSDYNNWNPVVGFRKDQHNVYLEAGTYYLQVKGSVYQDWGSDSVGTYQICTSFTSANSTESEPNNSIGLANPVSLGEEIRGVISENGDYDFFAFSLTTSGKVSLDITAYTEWYSLLIYDKMGTRVWFTDLNQKNQAVGFRKDQHNVYLEVGTYYLQVRGSKYQDWQSDCVGTYQISTSFISANATEREPNDSVAQANHVTLGVESRGVIAENGDYDFFAFTLSQTEAVPIYVTSYMEWYSLLIYDEMGTRQWYSDCNQRNQTTGFRQDSHVGPTLEPGTYYLQVKGSKYQDWGSDCPGTYTITIGEKEHPDEPVSVTGVSLDQHNLLMEPGDSVELTATISPSDASDTGMAWSSDDMSVAEVDGDGNVTAVGEGYATITVITNDGGYTDECLVTVKSSQHVPSGDDDWTTIKLPFSDVGEEAWYYNAVKYVYANNLMSGTGTATFAPSRQTTRGQLVTILYRLEGEPSVSGGIAFTDVKASDYFSKAVRWAFNNGIVSGVGKGKFAPNNPVTREQMVTILYRYAKFAKYDTSQAGNLSKFSDYNQISSWAVPAMRWSYGSGLISGKSSTTLAPVGKTTRAEMATILMRFCENVVGTEDPGQDSVSMEDLAGKWEVDVQRTMDVNDASMWELFGTAFSHYGSGMNIEISGDFNYYIGAGIGGKGSCQMGDNMLNYEIITYEENQPENGTITIEKFNGAIRLLFFTRDTSIPVYWEKV